MRRYIISHFREPMDIAASNFNEASAIFGGGENLHLGLRNVTAQYRPALIGIATTCLTETIGEDMERLLGEYRAAGEGTDLPEIIATSTASYRGTHVNGFHATVRSVVGTMAQAVARHSGINLLPGMVSPADLRYLKEIFEDFDIPLTLLPDYSETLDGPALASYAKIPAGGTSPGAIRAMGGALATIEFGRTLAAHETAGALLEGRFGVPCHRVGLPIGVQETDRLYRLIEELSGAVTPARHQLERGRLIDAYVDGHKYVFGKRAIVYGDEDLVVGLTAFLSEIGMTPVLCASGGESRWLARAIDAVTDGAAAAGTIRVREGADFMAIGEEAAELKPDLLIGNSKGYASARHLGVPLIRVGFPIHDRIGGQRVLHLGYRGAQRLFDEIVNVLLERKQEDSSVGYSYM
jgi:nitrogenase molybdenum-iron protein NifN